MAKLTPRRKPVPKKTEPKETESKLTFIGNGFAIEAPEEQEFIEVDQVGVKMALKALIANERPFLDFLYKKWEEFNEKYFGGQLTYPLITIEKMSNRTLGSYAPVTESMGISNHIRLNRSFVALNSEERVLETLLHEMIHQWQDEVLYAKNGEKPKKGQKKRPKDWHNKDFKDMAEKVGIPAIGDRCYGSPARMPEPKSYNRKFVCRCVASNGYPLTIWSTRQVDAVCRICKSSFIEVPKGGKVIRVKSSHIEPEGVDMVEESMRTRYDYFKKFKSKEERDDFVDSYTLIIDDRYETGVYQRNHNGFKQGFTHWIAFSYSPKSVIQAYNKYGSLKKAAEYLGVSTQDLNGIIEKYQIDFKKGEYTDGKRRIKV